MLRIVAPLLIGAALLVGCKSAPAGPSDGAVWVSTNNHIYPPGTASWTCPSPGAIIRSESAPAACGLPAEQPGVPDMTAVAPVPAVCAQCPPVAGVRTSGTPFVAWGLGLLFLFGAILQFGVRVGATVGVCVIVCLLAAGCAAPNVAEMVGLATTDEIGELKGETGNLGQRVAGAGLTLVEVLGILLGGGGVGTLLVRLMRGKADRKGKAVAEAKKVLDTAPPA